MELSAAVTHVPKAIETRYRGRFFRSRLEARWAVFFTALEIQFDYEPEAYKLPSGNYLPDFFIKAQRLFPKPLWCEVKPPLSTDSTARLGDLVLATKIRGTVLHAIPDSDPFELAMETNELWEFDACQDESGRWGLGEDGEHCFCQCPTCHCFGFEFLGRAERIECACVDGKDGDRHKLYSSWTPALRHAYTCALSMRFDEFNGGL